MFSCFMAQEQLLGIISPVPSGLEIEVLFMAHPSALEIKQME